MSVVFAWLIAYFAAGFRWVWRDQLRRGSDRKPYVRSRSARWATRLLWLPMSIAFAVQYARQRDPQKRDLREHLFQDALPAYAIFLSIGLLTTWALRR